MYAILGIFQTNTGIERRSASADRQVYEAQPARSYLDRKENAVGF
jgi:hypothetical protein